MQAVTRRTDGTKVAVNMAHVLMLIDHIQFCAIVFARETPACPDMDVDAALAEFDEHPGIFRSRMYDEDGKCRPVLLNRAQIAYAEACPEGTRLHPVEKPAFTIEAHFEEWISAGE
jgi:hypothetical protein